MECAENASLIPRVVSVSRVHLARVSLCAGPCGDLHVTNNLVEVRSETVLLRYSLRVAKGHL